MFNLKRYHIILRISVVLFLLGFFFYGNQQLFAMAYIGAYIFVVLRTLNIQSRKRMKFLMIASYSFILFMLLTFNNLIVFDINISTLKMYVGRIFSVLGIALPFIIERFFIVNKYASFYFPSVQEFSTVSFSELKNNISKALTTAKDVKTAGKKLSPDRLNEIVTDLPRHSSFEYVNNGSLTDLYFKTAYAALDDPYVYLIVSNTGSAAADIISVFTKKQYNHASLAFDKDLQTIVSYNGGERVYPPGLNYEMIEFFNKKPDSSIIVYRIKATKEQKQMMIDHIKEINTEGSAYNIMGLVLKRSHKSNIMFCSQFVYKMLKYAGLEYFEMEDAKVKPTDLVELDYYRKLEFAYEIYLNDIKAKSV